MQVSGFVLNARLPPSKIGRQTPAAVAIAISGVQVLVNFGGSSFKCDISSLELDALHCIQDQVLQTQVSLDVKVISPF